MNKHNNPAIICVFVDVSYSSLVTICFRQEGHERVAGSGPSRVLVIIAKIK